MVTWIISNGVCAGVGVAQRARAQERGALVGGVPRVSPRRVEPLRDDLTRLPAVRVQLRAHLHARGDCTALDTRRTILHS